MKKQNIKIINPLLFYGAIIILFIYNFRNVNQGIDVTDTGYHFSNFLYVNDIDPMWIFSTYLASGLGHLFTLLPGGDTLLGINIYTSFIPAFLGSIVFCFFVKVIKAGFWESFIGVLVSLALCWCPTTCVYNYLTYLFFCAGAMLLYVGLISEKNRYCIAAGICLGLNVLVRFPNVAEAALILTVWYTCFLRREKFTSYLQKTGYCLLGYIVGLGIVFAQIAFKYGIDEYVNGIIRLLGMTSDAPDYTLYSMIYSLIQAYIFSGKWVLIIVICIVLGMAGYQVLPGKYILLKNIGYGMCCLVLMRWFYGQGMFSLAYDGYGSIFNWGAVTIIAALLLALWQIISPKASVSDKVLAAIIIIIIGITPLGSNNQLYANINNMFLIAPYVIRVFVKIAKDQQMFQFTLRRFSFRLSKAPLLIMSAVCLLFLMWQSLLFGNVFIFRDSVPRDYEVTSIASVAGMKTNERNAMELQALGEYVQEHNLSGQKVLLFGDIPALSGYLRMPFVLSPWPDLPSYSNNTFETELNFVLNNIEKDRPVIILGHEFYDFLTDQLEDEEIRLTFEKKYGFKLSLIHDMIKEYGYKCTFENQTYVILE